MATAWCVSCDKMVTVSNVQRVMTKNNRVRETSECACGRKTSKFVKAGT